MIADESTIIGRSALDDYYDFAQEEWSLELDAYNQASLGRRLRKILNDLHLADLDSLRALVYPVFPRWRAKEQIRLLQLDCSSDKEVFSLCIMIEQEGLCERLQIIATDIIEAAMEKLWQHLKSEAFLCIGDQESLLFRNNKSQRFARLDTSANLYQKQ